MGTLDADRAGRLADSEALTEASFAAAVQPCLVSMTRLAARLGPRGSEDDIVQEALVRAWRHMKRFDPKRGALSPWLLAIVANEARRARKPVRPVVTRGANDIGAPDGRLDIERAVQNLPPRQRLAVDCYYFAGLTISETAAVMHCAEGTVKSTLFDARRRLQGELEVRS